MFGNNKCLVVAEKLTVNAYVHFQGFTTLSTQGIKDVMTGISANHFEVKAWEETQKDKKEDDHCSGRPRPVKQAKRSADDKRFLYFCTENRPPLYSQDFTQEELRELHEASEEHGEESKNGLKEHLCSMKYPTNPVVAFKRMREDAIDYYRVAVKRPRVSFQKDIMCTMLFHPQFTEEWKKFCAENL